MDAVDSIGAAATDANDRPLTTAVMERVEVS
jgi:hypothetical protein